MSIENLIETKKSINETGSAPEKPPDYIGFLKAEGKNIITSFFYYLVSGCIVLYLSKLAFANVIPTDFPDIKYTPPPENTFDTDYNYGSEDNSPSMSPNNEIPTETLNPMQPEPNGTTQPFKQNLYKPTEISNPINTEGIGPNTVMNPLLAQRGGESNKPVIVETNIVKIGGIFGLGAKETLSTKLEFEPKEINKLYDTGLIGYLRSMPLNPKKATIFGNFFNKIFCDTLKINNSIINVIFGKLYSYLSESVIIILAPILLGLYFTVFYLINMAVFVFTFVTNFHYIFKEKNVTYDYVSYDTLTEPLSFAWSIFLAIICIVFFGVGMGFMPIFMMLYSLLSPLAISGINVTNKNEKSEMGFAQFCKNVIYYKGQLFLAILSFGLLGQSKTYLGATGFAGCIAGVLFCIFALHLYNLSYNPKTDTNLSMSLSSVKHMQQGGNVYKKNNKIKKTKKNQQVE